MFNGITAGDLGLPTSSWLSIKRLKTLSIENLPALLVRQGVPLELDALSTQSITCRLFEEVPTTGPVKNTPVSFSVTLPASETRTTLILGGFSGLDSHCLHASRSETTLSAESTKQVLSLAGALEVNLTDRLAVACFASSLIEKVTGLKDLYACVRDRSDGGGLKKIVLHLNTSDYLDLTHSIPFPGGALSFGLASPSEIGVITARLLENGIIHPSGDSCHVLVGPLSPAARHSRASAPGDNALAMDNARALQRTLSEVYPESKPHIMAESGRPMHAILLSFPSAGSAEQMRKALLPAESAFAAFWDSSSSFCIGIAGPPKCLQVLTASQLSTIAVSCGRTPLPPRPRQHAPRSGLMVLPNAFGPRAGLGPDNPSRDINRAHRR